MTTVPAVYTAIHAISAQLARDGIGKNRKNAQQGYSFRGIDDVMNALAPLLVAHKLVIIPRCVSREASERVTKSGGTLYYVALHAEFDFVSADDGSKHTAATYGEGMDSADKATNKAMSAAYKYAAFLTFCIPTEGDGDVDADSVTPERTVPRHPAPAPAAPAAEAPSKPSCITTPAKDPKTLALEREEEAKRRAAERAFESEETKRLLLGKLGDMQPGSKGWDARWAVYAEMARHVYVKLNPHDRAVVTRAEHKRKDNHRDALAKLPPHNPETGEIEDSEAA